MTFYIIIKDAALSNNFLSDGVEPIAANTKDGLDVSECLVGTFLVHGRFSG
jgi:hypothetical protein